MSATPLPGVSPIVKFKSYNARAETVRRLSVLEQLEAKGTLTAEQVDAGRDLAGLLEAAERAVWSLSRDDAMPTAPWRDPLAGWTRGCAVGGRRKPPPQVRPHPKRARTAGDGINHHRIMAMRGGRQAALVLKAMPKDVREIVMAIAVYDKTPGHVAEAMKGYPGGSAHRWVIRRLRKGLDEVAAELRPALKDVA